MSSELCQVDLRFHLELCPTGFQGHSWHSNTLSLKTGSAEGTRAESIAAGFTLFCLQILHSYQQCLSQPSAIWNKASLPWSRQSDPTARAFAEETAFWLVTLKPYYAPLSSALLCLEGLLTFPWTPQEKEVLCSLPQLCFGSVLFLEPGS